MKKWMNGLKKVVAMVMMTSMLLTVVSTTASDEGISICGMDIEENDNLR